jgi:hypothetical protein
VWQADPRGGRPNGSFSASVGGNDPVLGQAIGYLVSGTYSNALDVRASETRAVARAGDVSAGQPSEVQINRFDGQSGRASVLMGGLANFGTLVGTRNRLAFNNTYNRTADNDARVERGVYEDQALPVQIQRLDYVQRSVWSSQLAGEHDLGRQRVEWSGALSGVTREQPDRSEIVYEVRPVAGGAAPQLLWLNTLPEGAVRTFAGLSERGGEGKADYRLQLGAAERPLTVRAGGLGRRTSRSSDVRSYGIFARALSDSLRALPPEILFGGRFTTPESQMLSVRSLAQGGSYDASDVLGAGYAMVDAALGSHFQLVTGARVERSDVLVNALNTLGEPSRARREFTDALPSVALNFRPSALQNVRVSVARTLARPEYRELAGIRTREVLGGVDTRGNPTSSARSSTTTTCAGSCTRAPARC